MEGKVLKLKRDLILTSVDDVHALLDIEQKCYFDPNDTAFFLLKLMEDGISNRGLVDNLVKEYDITPDRAISELDTFISELDGLGLLEITVGDLKLQELPEAKIKKLFIPPILSYQEELVVSTAQMPVTIYGPSVPD